MVVVRGQVAPAQVGELQSGGSSRLLSSVSGLRPYPSCCWLHAPLQAPSSLSPRWAGTCSTCRAVRTRWREVRCGESGAWLLGELHSGASRGDQTTLHRAWGGSQLVAESSVRPQGAYSLRGVRHTQEKATVLLRAYAQQCSGKAVSRISGLQGQGGGCTPGPCVKLREAGTRLRAVPGRPSCRAATPRIGDVIQKLAPFLKMYSEYVKNFERAAELLAAWTDKSPPFQEVIARIQSSEASGNLSLQHHMLEPVQRIPRYELLLKDYVQKLPAQAPDRADAQKALDMIFSAAQHSNAAIAEMERLQDLWEVYQRLGLEDDIVDPSNALLREGPVLKISFRRNDPMERYLFLFNNMLLYCVPKVIQVGAHFQVRTRIDVAGMKVRALMDPEFPHSFLVSGKQRTLELQARSQEEMISWLQACQAAIDQVEKRNETFKAAVQGPEGGLQEPQLQSEELGLRAPQWVRDKMVTMCMRCREPFNALTRRRHHCRACGYVVCARCSEYRAELKYNANRPSRVCLDCYAFLTGCVLPGNKDRRPGILEKGSSAGSGQSLMCSFLQLSGDKWGRSSSRGWCVIPQDDPLVLYVYAAPQDTRAHTSIPLLGYQVTAGPQGDPRLFQLQQSGQLYTFKADSEELRDRWVKAMERAAQGWGPGGPDAGDLCD
nr:FYVE, RhoGEF and PH domain-containing protein 2 isoform X1 [Oryctolagus cuniculus]